MLIDYVSSAMDVLDFEQLFKDSPKIPGQQAQKYNRLMIEGLAANDVEVHAISGRPVTRTNYKGKYLPGKKNFSGKVSWLYGSIMNIPVIKNLWQMYGTYKAVSRDCKYKETAVVLDILNASIAYGASLAAKRRHRPCIGVVTDLPELMVTGTRNDHVELVHKAMKNCSGFVFLTEAMNQVVNPKEKPYVIVEALCDTKMGVMERRPAEREKCIYAGLLDARYGAKAMVEGFIKAGVPGAELHVYGNGPYSDELKTVANSHENIIYHGTVMNAEIVREELTAALLVNPRPTHEEFTKYSFPSKNMEYMVSGTPVLTTDLPGMPREYLPYVYIIEKEDVQGIAEAFQRVLNIPISERNQKGKEAKTFVLKEKNNLTQAAKVIQLINEQLS